MYLIRKFLSNAESASFFSKGTAGVERKEQSCKLFPKPRTSFVSKIYLAIQYSSFS